LVFLAHVWACSPFLLLWTRDPHVQEVIGDQAIANLRPLVGLIVAYLGVRTYLAYRDPKWLKWDYVFPPIDVALITLILYISHRGPMSNITTLYFLAIIEAAGTLNVFWAAFVGLLVVVGTGVSTMSGVQMPLPASGQQSLAQLLQDDPLNVTFRLYFLIVISSLMTYQALLAAELRERLGVAADRNRIALDMHDGVQGHLITVASQLELIGHVATINPTRAAELAKESRETARAAADELRFLVQRLRAPGLKDGFVPALRQYAHNVCERNGLRLEFTVSGVERMLEPEVENTLFRIAQEAMNNVVKHANAEQVSIAVAYTAESASLHVTDDGGGFDTGTAPPGMGLEGMRSRATKLDGELTIRSNRPGGTTVVANLPVTDHVS